MTKLSDVIGQDLGIQWISRAYRAERLPHAMIFAGPSGVGKATVAAALAALILCEKPKDLEPCGECGSCRAFDAATHPDFHVITKELIRFHDKSGKSKGVELSIQVLRPELIEPAGRKPVLGRGKVFVIEQAELMNPQAQNSLLKTLEEPAGKTLIVLLTDRPDWLLPTIRSRSQLVPFVPLDKAVISRTLQDRGMESSLAKEAAEVCGGSLGLAIRWVEDGVLERSRQLWELLDRSLTGRSGGELEAWLKQAAEDFAQRQLKRDELASKEQATREGLELYLTLAAERIRGRLGRAAGSAAMEQACGAIESIARAQEYLSANVNTSLLLQQLSLALAGGAP